MTLCMCILPRVVDLCSLSLFVVSPSYFKRLCSQTEMFVFIVIERLFSLYVVALVFCIPLLFKVSAVILQVVSCLGGCLHGLYVVYLHLSDKFVSLKLALLESNNKFTAIS